MGSNSLDVTLVMIAKNEERCIRRALVSASPFVNRMIVVDTGSSDATVAIAKSCGAEVHFYEWNEDFSAARNFALDIADADWSLFIDADEWIEEGGKKLQRLDIKLPFVGLVEVSSECDIDKLTSRSHSWIPRLLPRGVRYVGRVHEQPVSTLQRIPFPVVLGHDGYSRLQVERKKGRNRKLLFRQLDSTPGDAYVLYQLGKDFEVHGEYADAAKYYSSASKLVLPDDPYRKGTYLGLIRCLGESGQLENALLIAAEVMNDFTQSAQYFFDMGNLFLIMGGQDPEDAMTKWLPMAEAAWIKCLEIGELPSSHSYTVGFGSFLAAKNIAVIYGVLGNSGQENKYLQLAQELKEKHL
jgi:glycosyltransferase involved in cell wall biosynthesis